jgi:hypothetical protein
MFINPIARTMDSGEIAAIVAVVGMVVCTENLNTGVVVMKSAQDGKCLTTPVR